MFFEPLRAFAKRRPRLGWRRAAKYLRREGWEVNNQAGSAALERRRTAGTHQNEDETPGRLRHPSRGDVDDLPERTMGNGFPVRSNHRWPPDQDAQHHRRVHPRMFEHRSDAFDHRRWRQNPPHTAHGDLRPTEFAQPGPTTTNPKPPAHS